MVAKDSNIRRLDQFAGLNPEVYLIGRKRFEAWLEQHRADLSSEPSYGRALRAAELDSCPSSAKPRLLRHHVEVAVRWLRHECSRQNNHWFVECGGDLRGMMKGIRLVPSVQRDRLGPVFQECGLWANGADHRRRFDRWEICFIDALDFIDAADPGGRGKFKRLYKEYVRALEDHQVTLTALHREMLDALGSTFSWQALKD